MAKSRVEKYIEINPIIRVGKSRLKTRRWEVKNARTNTVVGIVSWHGAWRKYCFFPEHDMLFDWDCMRLIAEFIETSTTNHYLALKWHKKLNLNQK